MQALNQFKDDATIANRYLADQLDDAERGVFETYMLQNPEVVRELEATARLKAGLRLLRDSGELDELVRPVRRMNQPFIMALAASVAVLVVGIMWLRWYSTPEPSLLVASISQLTDRSGNELRVGATRAMLRTRNEGYDAIIQLPGVQQAIEFRVLPQVTDPSIRYRVSLLRLEDDGSVASVATLKDLAPAADGFITMFADSAALAPGRYQLAVSRDDRKDAAPITETFLVKILPPAAG